MSGAAIAWIGVVVLAVVAVVLVELTRGRWSRSDRAAPWRRPLTLGLAVVFLIVALPVIYLSWHQR